MDIWYADLGDQNGTCETKGIRPVLIISNDISNRCAPVVTVLPMTKEVKRLDLVAHVVEGKSMIMAEQITVIDHIKPFRGDEKIQYDLDNLQALCKKHHDEKTGRFDSHPEYKVLTTANVLQFTRQNGYRESC